MTTRTTSDRVREALSAADFPARKDELVRYAERAEADDHTVRALSAMPPETYGNLDEVLQSVPLEQDRNPTEGAEQRREHRKSGLAEAERDVSPHPIVEELGENRGS